MTQHYMLRTTYHVLVENDEFIAPVDAVDVEGVVGGVRARVTDHDDDTATVWGPRQ